MRTGLALVLALGMAACERREGGAAPAGEKGAPSATTVPATGPAGEEAVLATVEAASVEIDGVVHAFPPTAVKLRQVGDRMTATVYSTAERAGAETGCAMNLRFSFPAEDWGAAGSGAARVVNATAGREETPFGLFLEDGEAHLVPADVAVELRREQGGATGRVTVKGRFVRRDLIAPDMPYANVSAAFDAAIEGP